MVGIGPQLNLLISAKSVYVVVAIIEVQTEISTQYYISQEKFIELIIRLLERHLRRTAARWQLLRNPDCTTALLTCTYICNPLSLYPDFGGCMANF